MAGDVPNCPSCARELGREGVWRSDGATCPNCRGELEFVAFPALTAGRAATHPLVAAMADDATCFFHAENRAVSVCAGCGRYLCTVCGIDFAGSRLCPGCMAARSRTGPKVDAGRGVVLHDSIALALAAAPLVLIFTFVFTLVTAPMALGYVIYAWRKPRSVVRRSRWRLWVALVLALAEIMGWSLFFFRLALS